MVDFNMVRRSISVIPDLAANITMMTGRTSHDDYVRGKMDASFYDGRFAVGLAASAAGVSRGCHGTPASASSGHL
jgi:hypothetical protein